MPSDTPALMRACANDEAWRRDHDAALGCVRVLIDTGQVDVNAKDNEGYTAFCAAVEWGRPIQLLQLLLAHGADVDAQTGSPGYTALAAACGAGCRDGESRPGVVRLLLKAKADTTLRWGAQGVQGGPKQTSKQWVHQQQRCACPTALTCMHQLTRHGAPQDGAHRGVRRIPRR